MKNLKRKMKALALVVLSLGAIACEESSDAPALTSATLTLNGSDSTVYGASSYVADASSLKIKVYEAWVSRNGDCSNPTKVFDNPGAGYQEFAGGINIGSGEIAVGTYPCVIMVMSDYIKFTPAADDGATCTAGVEYTSDVCNSSFPADLDFPDGTMATCGDGEGQIPIYLSTWSSTVDGSGSSNNPFVAPTTVGDADYGFLLGNALTVNGNTNNYFIVDVSNKIDGSGAACEMLPPNWSFE